MVKVNGERYPGRSLYMIAAGLQRHLAESGNAILLLSQNDRRLDINKFILYEYYYDSGVDRTRFFESLDLEISDELLSNMVLPDSCNSAKVVMSGSVFNNCTFNLSK